jgi:protein tyrosine phosphatase (PTP) superfamily phosphohydrolase (DUF442 family)
MKKILYISLCCLAAVIAFGDEVVTNRPVAWAQSVKLEGVPNLHLVSTNLYRSAQPTAQGMQSMQAKGVKTVINLRSFHSDRDELEGTKLGYEHIYMKAWHPERKETIRFLKIVTDPKQAPVLVHCLHGADRTGTMCALYRVAVQGWSKDEAIREMKQGGFGFHAVFGNLTEWIKELDVDSLKKDAGMTTAAGQAPAAAETVKSASETSREIGGIFLEIFSLYWKDALLFSGGFFLKVTSAWLCSFFAALVMAVFIWRGIRKRGWLDAPWRYYKYFRWLWVPVIILPFAFGIATTAGWLTGGSVTKRAIVEDRIIPRAVVSLYCAFGLQEGNDDSAPIRTPDDIIATLEKGDELLSSTIAEVGDVAKQSLRADFEKDGSLSVPERMILFVIPSERLGEVLFGEFIDEDPKLVLAVLAAFAANSEAGQEYINSTSQGVVIAAALSRGIRKFELECAAGIDSIIIGSVMAALCIAAIPAFLLLAFRGIVRLRDKKDAAVDAGTS